MLSYCFRLVVHGFGFVWCLLGDAKSVVELLAYWQGRFDRHRNGHVWMVIPHCLMWCIWKEMNSKSFEDTKRSMLDLKLFFFRTLLD